MRKLLIVIFLIFLLPQTVNATEYIAPMAPQSAQKYMPPETDSFFDGLWYIIKEAISELNPNIAQAARTSLSIIAVMMLVALAESFTGVSKQLTNLVAAVSLGLLLFRASNSLLHLGIETIDVLNDYTKLLLPVLAAATVACGAPASSSALYTGTVVFGSILSSVTKNLLTPLIYILITLGIVTYALGEKNFQGIADFVKWLATTIIKTSLYIFTGYMSITGVVSGSVDASTLKATKLTISGVVPVVGGIISDASESILLSASIMRNSAGIYGMLAVAAICIGPFIQIGAHYLLLKITTGICSIFPAKQGHALLKNVVSVMGLVLAMVGAMCLMLLISIVCFLRSVA